MPFPAAGGALLVRLVNPLKDDLMLTMGYVRWTSRCQRARDCSGSRWQTVNHDLPKLDRVHHHDPCRIVNGDTQACDSTR